MIFSATAHNFLALFLRRKLIMRSSLENDGSSSSDKAFMPHFEIRRTASCTLASSPAAVHLDNDVIVNIRKLVTVPLEDRTRDTEAQKLRNGNDIESISLSRKIFGDVAVACTVTFGVSHFLAVVDKSIVQRAVGSHTLLQSSAQTVSNMIRHPVSFIRSPAFLMMWGVYAATYTTANTLKTLAEHDDFLRRRKEAEQPNTARGQTTSGEREMGIFLSTTAVNSGVSMLKERAYAQVSPYSQLSRLSFQEIYNLKCTVRRVLSTS